MWIYKNTDKKYVSKLSNPRHHIILCMIFYQTEKYEEKLEWIKVQIPVTAAD